MNLTQRKSYLEEMSLGFSGWRRVFTIDRDEESTSPEITELDQKFLTHTALLIGQYLKRKFSHPRVVIARDSRPTGTAIEETIKQALLSESVGLLELGIVPLPQCLAWVKQNPQINGFVYITASHNPVGHNGIKLGDAEGKMISPEENSQLITNLRKAFLANDMPAIKKITPQQDQEKIKKHFKQSCRAYAALIRSVMSRDKSSVWKELNLMKDHLDQESLSVVCDFNGSARIRSYDADFYRDWNLHLIPINHQIGEFDHGMAPEGNSLMKLKESILSIKREKKHRPLFGYAVDCDGDRGNFVFPTNSTSIDQESSVIIPDAQTTFALSVLSELVFIKLFFPEKLKNLVIIANGPTSLRIDDLCKRFDVPCVRSEVGEINVIQLAQKLSSEKKWIRIIGEGSNGGNITFPSTVRDPLSSVGSLLKLLFLKKGERSFRNEVVQVLNLKEEVISCPLKFLSALIQKLNCFYSTDLFSSQACLKIFSQNQLQFKANYENLFDHRFNHSLKEKFNISSYLFVHYEGISTLIGKGNYQKGTGGLKVKLFDSNQKEIGFLWFRSSQTEKILRFSAEFNTLEGRNDLLDFQKKLLKEVDQAELTKNR